jgi:hypothetical protein
VKKNVRGKEFDLGDPKGMRMACGEEGCDLDDPKGMGTNRGEEGNRDGEEGSRDHDSDFGRIEEAGSVSGVDCNGLFLQSSRSCDRLAQHALGVSCHSTRALGGAPLLSLAEQLRQLFRPRSVYTIGQKKLRLKRWVTSPAFITFSCMSSSFLASRISFGTP